MSTTPVQSQGETRSPERERRAEFDGTFVWNAVEPDSHRSLSVAVVETLATAEGVDVTDLEVQLGDSIDPEALDDLFERRDGANERWQVDFVAGGHHVCVRSDGAILVSK